MMSVAGYTVVGVLDELPAFPEVCESWNSVGSPVLSYIEHPL